MNYLAHVHLSGKNNDLLIGNFIADGLKNTPLAYFTEEVQEGIMLHRMIDQFTDNHLIFKRSKGRLFDKHRHYSAVLVDMFYDHFLANNWMKFSNTSLSSYSKFVYKKLDERRDEFPESAKKFLSYIISRDSLNNYQYLKEFEITLNHLSSRTKYKSDFGSAILDLKQDYDAFESDFMSFYPVLQKEVGIYLKNKGIPY